MEQKLCSVTIERNAINITYDEGVHLDINQSISLKEELEKNLKNTSSIQLDISKVDVITTPSIQVIIAAARDCKRLHKGFVVAMSEKVKSKFQLLGFEEMTREWIE